MAGALSTGATCISMPKFDPILFLEALQNHKITFAPLVPPIIAVRIIGGRAEINGFLFALLDRCTYTCLFFPALLPPLSVSCKAPCCVQLRPVVPESDLLWCGAAGRGDAGGGHETDSRLHREAGEEGGG